MKTKNNAFTVAEILITVSIIGLMTALLVTTLHRNMSKNKNMHKITSIGLHEDFGKMYEEILTTRTADKNDMRYLIDIDGNNEVNSDDILYFILLSINGEKAQSCEKLVTPSNYVKPSDLVCAQLSKRTFIGVKYDKTCNTRVEGFIEVMDEEPKSATTCGYIAYSLKDSDGIMGEDFFIYPFNKKSFQKRTIKRNS